MPLRSMVIRSASALLLALALAAPGELSAQKTPARPARDTVQTVDRDAADAEPVDTDTVPGPGPFTRAQGTRGPFAVQSSGTVSTRPPRDSAVWVSAPARTAARDTTARRTTTAARDTVARHTTTAARDTAARRNTSRDTAATRRTPTAARDTAARRTTTVARDTAARRTTTVARDTAARRTTTAVRDTAARRTTTAARDTAARRNTSRDTAATRRTTTAVRDTAARRNTSRDTAATRRTTTAARDTSARRNTSRDTTATRRTTTAARDSAARRNAPRDTVVIGRGNRADTAGTRRTAPRDTVRPRAAAAPRTHRVGAGETFYGIARRYGITTAQLRAVNPDLDWEDVRTGDVLRLPANARDTRAGASSTPAPARGGATTPARTQPAAPRGSRTHTVAAGETLFGIARQYGVTRDAIIEANELETDQVRTGQRLVIPPASR